MRLFVDFVEDNELIDFALNDDTYALDATFVESCENLEFDFGEIQQTHIYSDDLDVYDGEYLITPKISQQTLDTESKVMEDNVTVKGIPCYTTSNSYGGDTVYIGKELE